MSRTRSEGTKLTDPGSLCPQISILCEKTCALFCAIGFWVFYSPKPVERSCSDIPSPTDISGAIVNPGHLQKVTPSGATFSQGGGIKIALSNIVNPGQVG
jgi:hypothetical protein